jgi:hypothetical protein
MDNKKRIKRETLLKKLRGLWMKVTNKPKEDMET